MYGVFRTRLGETVSQDFKRENDDVLRLELEHDGHNRTFYLKRYWSGDFGKIWKRAFRDSVFDRAIVKAEFEKIGQLGSYGIRIPPLVAYGYQRFGGGVINPFIITESIPDGMRLDELLGRWIGLQPSVKQDGYRFYAARGGRKQYAIDARTWIRAA